MTVPTPLRMTRLQRLRRHLRTIRCSRRGHDWIGGSPSEFIPTRAMCLCCGVSDHTLPWGDCISGLGSHHPLADHYRIVDGQLENRAAGRCGRPR